MFPRSNINLKGIGINSFTLDGFATRCLTLHGMVMSDPNFSNSRIVKENKDAAPMKMDEHPEFIKLKVYIMNNLISPLLKRDFELLKKNYYSIKVLKQKLKAFKSTSNLSEIQIYLNLLEVILVSLNTSNNNEALQKTLYGNAESSKLLITTKTILLSAPYEIYNLFFGRPVKEADKPITYDDDKIQFLKDLLNRKPFILHDEIKSLLRNEPEFYDDLLPEYKDEKDRFTWGLTDAAKNHETKRRAKNLDKLIK